MATPLRVLIVGGGTGGHVIPALAIADQLKKEFGAEIRFVGTSRGIETRLVPEAGYPLELIQVGALKNVTLATRAKTLLALPRAVFYCLGLIRRFRPDVVIGVGGYASGPGMMAAILARVPSLAFEPNVVPGFANRVVAKFVTAAAVHFQESARYFRNAQVTGVPVREDFFKIPPHNGDGGPELLISGAATASLLVFGGSQGARVINQVMPAAVRLLRAHLPPVTIVHQTGERDFDQTQAAYYEAGVTAKVVKFIPAMAKAFAAADVLVCRSGASTVAEVAAAGRPAVFIPFPRAADDHQTRNAEAFVKRNAGILLPEAELTPERLAEILSALLADRKALAAMAASGKSLAHPDAAREISNLAVRIAGRV